MKTLIFCKPEPTNENEPTRIICSDTNGDKIATVYCDQAVKFVGAVTLQLSELTQIKTIAENFWLFYDNLNYAVNK
jgi:hypothetical protein